MNITIQPIGYVKSDRLDLSDDDWGGVVSEIMLMSELPAEAFDGIESFSHLEIIFYFNQLDSDHPVLCGHPRENQSWPRVGIFAQRKKNRPNRIGTTIVKLRRREGRKIYVEGLDAIDGTPIIDIKPVLSEFLPREKVMQPAWTKELMKAYWKKA